MRARTRAPFIHTRTRVRVRERREKRESRLAAEIENVGENPSANRQDGDVKITLGRLRAGGPDFRSASPEE
jgi:hypothetical protein